jgi:hypothetical protein
VVLVSAALLAGACSNGGGVGRTGPTIPEERSTTTSPSTSTLDPAAYTVPETIDQAYVQRVVSAYDHVLGDAIRVLKRDGGLSDDFLKHLLAIYTEPEFEFQQKLWAEELSAGRPAKTPSTAGDPITRVLSVARGDSHCITAKVTRDFAPTLLPGEPPTSPEHDHYVVLVTRRQAPDPLKVNPTPWVLAFDGSKNDNSVPVNSCDD